MWHKPKARATVELVCTVVVGDPHEPTLLMLSTLAQDGGWRRPGRPAGCPGRLLVRSDDCSRLPAAPRFATAADRRDGVSSVRWRLPWWSR